MIEAVQFRNFKVLRDTTLPLSRFTLLVGPNGSGKSTALQAFHMIRRTKEQLFHRLVTVSQPVTDEQEAIVEVILHWGAPYTGVITIARWISTPQVMSLRHQPQDTGPHVTIAPQTLEALNAMLAGIRIYTLNASAIQNPVMLVPNSS
jgi:energy-coupling factor transporter ATP-binding protein EcfA2